MIWLPEGYEIRRTGSNCPLLLAFARYPLHLEQQAFVIYSWLHIRSTHFFSYRHLNLLSTAYMRDSPYKCIFQSLN